MLATQFRDTEHSLWRLDRPSQPLRGLPSPRMSTLFASSLSSRQSGWQSRYPDQQSDESPKLEVRLSPSAMEEKTAAIPDLESSQPRVSSFSGAILPQPIAYKASLSERSARALVHGDDSSSGGNLPERDESGGINVAPRIETSLKDDDDCMDDDDLFDGESEHSQRLRSASERVAARRKMKRFRLTHQQTRFLMSEFVKQPHPDAAHRDRLSRQIPGLSPRQVQVWFQNRRAKIKRLNVEDRDRVIRMRAVPDEFDTVQALHSPYGAVHGYAHSLSTSPDLGQQGYNRGLMARQLMVDVRRSNLEGRTSPGLTPPFDSVGFSNGAGNSDVASNLSSSSSERFPYYITSSLGANSRLSTPFQGIRPLPSPHFRDSAARPRADSAHSSMADCQQPIYPAPSSGYDGEYYPGIGLDSRTRFTPATTFSAGLEPGNQYRPDGPSSTETAGLSGQDRSGSHQYTNPSMYPTSYPPPQIPDSNGLITRSSRDSSPYHSLPTAQALAAASYQQHGRSNPPLGGYYEPTVLPYAND
ncbi:unnamed protein product [Clonostachys byssicola]|uniref:Homeobox domain-containing protein n=1 Tax=Clonostachys byssicola TaxID=160290 RepID=A0A9N9UUR6_9HYPO|nr:unnamed protein product [Clonostachys byssicola]